MLKVNTVYTPTPFLLEGVQGGGGGPGTTNQILNPGGGAWQDLNFLRGVAGKERVAVFITILVTIKRWD